MKRAVALALLAGALAAARPQAGAAQDGSVFLPVGSRAPDVPVVGATRYGVVRDPVRLSDFRGETVVLAFFFRARTRG